MTNIKLDLWDSFIKNIPMPEACTYDQFTAARKTLWLVENQEFEIWWIKQLQGIINPTIKTEVNELIDGALERVSRD